MSRSNYCFSKTFSHSLANSSLFILNLIYFIFFHHRRMHNYAFHILFKHFINSVQKQYFKLKRVLHNLFNIKNFREDSHIMIKRIYYNLKKISNIFSSYIFLQKFRCVSCVSIYNSFKFCKLERFYLHHLYTIIL